MRIIPHPRFGWMYTNEVYSLEVRSQKDFELHLEHYAECVVCDGYTRLLGVVCHRCYGTLHWRCVEPDVRLFICHACLVGDL